MPTVREYEAALGQNPADTEAFVGLRKAFRQSKEFDRLITLYETRAQAIDDGAKAAELFYLAAELRFDQLSDTAGAEADLANAVHRDPSHIRAAARLKDLYREQGRIPEYMEMLEMEAVAVARSRDPAHLEELASEMGQLFVNHFGRLERTVRSAQRPGKLAAGDVKTIESARKIYRALGDFRSVSRLYELELEGTTDPKRRADLLLGLGRVLAEKLEDLDAAAQRLAEVIRLRPRDEKALELLAGVYAHPSWLAEDGADKSAGIYYQIARRRQEAGDTEGSIAALRRALVAVPGHPEASDLIERTYYDARRLQDLDRYYRERVTAATTQDDRINFLYKRAQLAEGDLGDTAEAQRIYSEIASHEEAGGPAGERLAELYAAGREYGKLAELREKQLGVVEEPIHRVRLMNELAQLYGERLGDRDQAAVYLHAILQIDPANLTALSAYADHFRDKGDWPALVDLLEFALEQARHTGAPTEELVTRLEEIAVVAEKNLNDPERAVAAWRQVEELDPAHARAREMQKRILLKTKRFDQIVPILEREAGAATDTPQRIDVLRRIAQIQREKLAAPARALEIYKQILDMSPRDAVALRAMVEIYEHEGDFVGLAATLRDQVDVAGTKQERVSLLRRLLVIYDERLDDVDDGAWAASEVLKLVPGDRDTLARLEDLLARAGDQAGLVQTLDYHAEHAGSPDERIQVLARAAEILDATLNDAARAAEHWEEVARLDPDDARALSSLGGIYGRLERHADLARILDAQIERLVADPQQQAEYLRRLAELSEAQLGDQRRGQRAWEALLEILPADIQALEALGRIYAENEDWGRLVRILERQIPLVDAERAVEIALRRADILDTSLDQSKQASEALEHVIAELDPRSWEAHERLRELYERDGNWTRVVKIAERQLFLVEVSEERLRRALELGALIRDRLRDEHKAIAAFERALEINPRSLEAMRALAPLYESTRDWGRVIALSERTLDLTEDVDERFALMLDIADVAEQHQQDPKAAFEWYRRAYVEHPTAESLERVDAAAERHGLFDELIAVYEAARARAAEDIEQIAASLKIASICEDKLADAPRAFAVLRDALPADPAGRQLLPLLERLAERTRDWTGLLDVYARVARGRPDVGERVRLLKQRAEVRERRMSDPSGALDELVRSFALDPDNVETHEEILRLAGLTGRWEDALKVEAQLFALAEDLPRKLGVARHAAALVENEVKDLVRAFRAYLNAFRLAPEDPEVVAHLWRLAGRIGRYEGAPAITPRAKEALDAVDDSGAGVDAVVDAGAGASPAGASPSATEDEPAEAAPPAETEAARAEGEIPDAGDAGADELPPVLGQPESIEATDAAGASPFDGEVEIGAPVGEDRFEVDGVAGAGEGEGEDDDETVDVDDAAVIAIAVDTESSGVLMELEVGDIDVDEVTPPPPPMGRGGAPRLPPPTPARRLPFGASFETPWEELAQAYENLPATDTEARRRYLLKQTEVWERGQKDVGKALAVLERAFRLDPDDKAVRAELERVGREHDRWDQVCDIYLGAIDEFAPADQSVSIHYEVARLRESLGQVPKAEERYRDIVELKPDEAPALDRLEEIVRADGRSADLAEILERRTSGTAGPLSWSGRRAKLRELADLYEKQLEKPYEAIDTLELLVSESLEEAAASDELARNETIYACESLARLYGRVGMWNKVIESLQRQAELVVEPAVVRAIRLRIAEVFERELGQSDRAVEAFEAVRDADPSNTEALAALERLYEALGRWDELQTTLARRAELSGGPERVEIVRRRARVLEERLGNPDAAATALRELGNPGLADLGLASMLVRNLRQAGLAHEAARTLGQQIEAARGRAAPAREIVPSLLELSVVRGDDLADPAGARQAIDDALALEPQNSGALAALARLELKENHFAAYASARRREARVLPDQAQAVAAFLDAGRVYRDQAGAPDEARACFEEALARDARSIEALQALGALHAAAGSWAEAREQLRRQLDLAESPETRAGILIELARSIRESGGDFAEAQTYVDQALELAPDHLPAVLAAADIYYKDGQWAAAEKRLTEALRRLRHNPEQSARLHARLAEVSDRLGRTDEAFRQLVEADRLAPGQLSIKLAMGENRFRAGKWREAVVYLAPLGDHPDAALQADEVADGLAHAAQAEIKLRRPERALGFYEAALALRANHAPSIRALADLALERGDKATARAYFERLVEGTADRESRVAVFESLGDLYRDAGEVPRAREAYESAIHLFERPTAVLVGVLEKALVLQRESGDVEAAARTANSLIELVQDPKERARRRREAATLIVARGGGDEALELLEAAAADNPEDDGILASLCDILISQGKRKLAAKRLADTLPLLPPPGETAAARQARAGLWERLGELRRKKDKPGAIASFESALQLEPQRMSARTALVDLYANEAEFADAALANLRQLVEADPTNAESAKTLAEAFAERGLFDRARCLYELCALVGPPDETVAAFLEGHPLAELKPDDHYPGALDDDDRKVLASPEARVMTDVFSLLWEGAPHLLNGRLEDFGVTADDKLSPMSDLDIAKLYVQIGKALGNQKTTLYLRKNAHVERMEIVVQAPPALVFGAELIAAPLAEARFEIARALELTRPEYTLTAGVRPKQFTELFGSVLRAFHPRHVKRRAGDDAAAEAAAAFRKNVPYKVSKGMVELFQEMGSTTWSSVRWRKVVADTGNRAGLLMCADLRAAVGAILRAERREAEDGVANTGRLAIDNEAIRALIRFAVSDDYFRLREKLGIAIAGPVRPGAN